jgi:hypothetical protein
MSRHCGNEQQSETTREHEAAGLAASDNSSADGDGGQHVAIATLAAIQ